MRNKPQAQSVSIECQRCGLPEAKDESKEFRWRQEVLHSKREGPHTNQKLSLDKRLSREWLSFCPVPPQQIWMKGPWLSMSVLF